jgi:hypothetical protein
MLRRLLPLLLLVLAPSFLSAQRHHPSRSELSADVRQLLMGLREAAARHDWSTMSPSFPEDGAITERVRGVVVGGPGSGGLSFWTPSAKPDFDQLNVAPIKEDLVAISLPFDDNGNSGAFGAVFERREGAWQLTCFREAFPGTDLAPGCVPDLHRSM